MLGYAQINPATPNGPRWPTLTQPTSLRHCLATSDVELRACRQPAIAAARLLHVAERGERHVVADDGELLVRHHVEDALAGGGTSRLVRIEGDVTGGVLDHKARV